MRERMKNKYKRGMTLVEILLAVAISLAFLSGVLMAFSQIMKTSDLAKARLEAVNNARSALEFMSIDIKAARMNYSIPFQNFTGTDATLSYGNGIDDDGDNKIDEETFDGKDNDGDWDSAKDDRHASAGGYFERAQFVSQADLGDAHVDEDCKFSRDSLTFRIYPDTANPNSRDDLITYSIINDVATYGEPNVLVRTIIKDYSSASPTTESAPVAFNVLSLDILYFNPNTMWPYWETSWDASTIAPHTNNIPLPVSVYLAITIPAGVFDINKYNPGDKVETVTLETVVNIEQVLIDPRWR